MKSVSTYSEFHETRLFVVSFSIFELRNTFTFNYFYFIKNPFPRHLTRGWDTAPYSIRESVAWQKNWAMSRNRISSTVVVSRSLAAPRRSREKLCFCTLACSGYTGSRTVAGKYASSETVKRLPDKSILTG